MARKSYTLLKDRKFRMLKVKQILETETDRSHHITMTQLVDLMDEEKDKDRRTLWDDIEDIENLGTKVRIDKTHQPWRLNVEERLFSISELKLMIDAVASSKFLTQEATEEIIRKLKMFCSRYEATELNRQTLIANRTKRIDTEYHDNVGILSKAIDARQKVTFKYFRLDYRNHREYQKKEIIVSPWVLLYSRDNYYLLAYDGKKMKYYRLDRVDNVKMLEDKSEGEEEYKKIKDELSFRTQSTFNLFGGEKVIVKLRCPVYYYYLIADQFGTNLFPILDNDKQYITVSVPVAIGDSFFGWILGMGSKVVIVDPPEVKRQMHALITKVIRAHRTTY